jgi:hypothetical protein
MIRWEPVCQPLRFPFRQTRRTVAERNKHRFRPARRVELLQSTTNIAAVPPDAPKCCRAQQTSLPSRQTRRNVAERNKHRFRPTTRADMLHTACNQSVEDKNDEQLTMKERFALFTGKSVKKGVKEAPFQGLA